MSASLVGSEMCIRDRPGSEPQRSASGALGFGPRLELHRPSRGSVIQAVSYTHLTLPTICSV
eukprot:3864417-Alexandrium_andersonii.AAC.1